jgi:hypothetical protein
MAEQLAVNDSATARRQMCPRRRPVVPFGLSRDIVNAMMLPGTGPIMLPIRQATQNPLLGILTGLTASVEYEPSAMIALGGLLKL